MGRVSRLGNPSAPQFAARRGPTAIWQTERGREIASLFMVGKSFYTTPPTASTADALPKKTHPRRYSSSTVPERMNA